MSEATLENNCKKCGDVWEHVINCSEPTDIYLSDEALDAATQAVIATVNESRND